MAGDPVRIAYVIGELGTGGAEYQLYELVRGLDRRRYLPRVFALATGGYWAARLRELGVDVRELRHVRSADLSRLLTLRRGLAEFAPQILHTVLWSGNAYGRLASVGLRIPVVITAERNVVRRPAWQIVFERALDVVTDRYLVNSQAIVGELVDHGRLPRRKMQVIHNGIDLGRLPAFDPDRRVARAALGFDPVRRLVVQVGRLEAQKDYPTFLAAAARVAARFPDVDFLVVGEGGLRADLEGVARGLGIAERVRFTGVRHDVPALLAGCDVCTLTSLYEGLPNVVIEAMATGAVAVATDVGGARELVASGETGYVVPARDVEAVASATTAVLADPERARAMAVAARRRIEAGFTVEAMVRDTSAAYDELLRAAGAGAPVRRAA
ncbi:MAG TPA: glycosyltransferase [Candidatus Eisenbacteria bacterium]|nr:glycosyltransferase [Candidatus Eisenbacteria bacterium]